MANEFTLSEIAHTGADEKTTPGRFQSVLFWLAGARWELLRHCPAAEQERVAVLGSTILVPTVMAFLGMFFFARSRFDEPPFFAVLAVSLLWAFVILNTDRVLIALYRPFLPAWKRITQVLFRLGLAGVVSLAISFPFCLDQYRPAIRFRFQTELQGKLNELQNTEASGRTALREKLLQIRDSTENDRRKLESDFATLSQNLSSQLPALERGQINPEVYADEKMEDERRRASAPDFVAPASGATLNLISKMDAQQESVERLKKDLEDQQNLHRRLVEAIAREEQGLPNEFYPEPKKAGTGPRVKDMRVRDLKVEAEIRKLETALKLGTHELESTGDAVVRARLTDRNNYIDALGKRRDAFVQEAADRERQRQEKLTALSEEIVRSRQALAQNLRKLEQHSEALEAEQSRAQKRHDDTYLPQIKRLEQKINGIFDPMEETIGLYKVIFVPPPDMPEDAKLRYRWMAGVFQFLVIFGTLFLLDLIPIIVKMLSRAGAYDILVDHAEFTANANYADFSRHASKTGSGWPGAVPADASNSKSLLRPNYHARTQTIAPLNSEPPRVTPDPASPQH
jgi:hypothetical protein